MPPKGQKTAILVVGMYRSGTSAITRILNILGYDVPKNLVQATPDNERGFWESESAVLLNNMIFASTKLTGKHWVAPDSDWFSSPAADEFREQAQALLLDEFGTSRRFVLKNPKLCLLLPLWIDALRGFGAEPLVVLPIRNPLDVAASLMKRDGIDQSTSLLMWLRYVLDSEFASRGLKRAYVRYEDVLEKNDAGTGEIERVLGISLSGDSADTRREINRFLSPELRHHWHEDAELLTNPAVSRWVQMSFEILDRWAHGQYKETDRADLDRIRSAFDEATPAFVNMTVEIRPATTNLLERDENIRQLTTKIPSARASHAEQIMQTTSSYSWKITLPLREVRRWLASPRKQVKRYTEMTINFGRKIYAALPLSPKTRIAFRGLLARHMVWILRVDNRLSIDRPSSPVATTGNFGTGLKLLPKNINIPTCSQPIVSVIIPIYGQIDYTLCCLTSIAANLPSIPFEVIVIDDCSTDNSLEILSEIEGVVLLKKFSNQGFIRSCNDGAKAAKGTYLCFLNNDTEVTTGWLDELLRTFQTFTNTGFVGSKLVYHDGTLQEAGGIIWRDGSAWNFGRNQDAGQPVYNYAREVDYCSGASIMVPRWLFNEIGGFDEHYLPAYCEDSDLALKIRDLGYGVIYQPFSVVVHHEGATSGTDLAEGVKSWQIVNSKKLYERWQHRLVAHQAPGTEVDTAKDRTARWRVLVLDHNTPMPKEDAGSVTAINIMLLLRDMGYQVTFLPSDNFVYLPDDTPLLQKSGIEVLYAPYCTSVIQHLKEYGKRYDLALVFRGEVAELYLDMIRQYSPAKVIFHTVDLHYLRMFREAKLLKSKAKHKNAGKMKQIELAAIQSADVSIVHSKIELELLDKEKLSGACIRVFSLSLDVPGTYATFDTRHDLVFVGGYRHPPNIDAVKYFVSDIMPVLRHRLPGIRFHIVGSRLPAELQTLAGADIVVHGFVEDLNALFDKMRVFVAPLRYGAGVKGKIGTAMSAGLPVVATSPAVEGMDLTDGEHSLVADDVEAFVDAVEKLYGDESLWTRLSQTGLKFAKQAWGPEASWKILSSILGDVGFPEIDKPLQPLKFYSLRASSDDNFDLIARDTEPDGPQPLKLTPIWKKTSYRKEKSGLRDIGAILGETAMHSVTVDQRITNESKVHSDALLPVIKQLSKTLQRTRPVRILELAAYAHTTGYDLQDSCDVEVVLADISTNTLALGEKIAKEIYSSEVIDAVDRVVVDFHDLQFPDEAFDIVFMASALHHTWDWQIVLNEMARVTQPGGVIYLYNEPCLREFCFYGFRTNRPDSFSEFEHALEENGTLRTFAEPYFGSRAEALFGIIENQTIPLSALINSLESVGNITHLVVTPEICMGSFEHELIALRTQGVEKVSARIREQLSQSASAVSVGSAEHAMGFQLPHQAEINGFAERMASRLCETLSVSDPDIFHIELAKIFGAGVETRIRKKGNLSQSKVDINLDDDFEKNSLGVMIGYPKSIDRILHTITDYAPSVQNSDKAQLRLFFPEPAWLPSVAENGIQIILLQTHKGEIHFSDLNQHEQLHVLMRLYVGYDGSPYRISLLINDQQIVYYDVYQNDSILLQHTLTEASEKFVLGIQTEYIEQQEAEGSVPTVNCSLLRVCGRITDSRVNISPIATVRDKGQFKEALRVCGRITDSRVNISPIATVRDEGQYKEALNSKALIEAQKIDQGPVPTSDIEYFDVEGFCVPCGRKVSLLVDRRYSSQTKNSSWVPNWRERLVCLFCGLNSRQRLMMTLLKQRVDHSTGGPSVIYLMEEVTPLFAWTQKNLSHHTIIGNEYLGHEYPGGTTINGIRHEDVLNLSFDDESIDIIVSNDVFEHVPEPSVAFAECARILKPGGEMLATFPFHDQQQKSAIRAQLLNNKVLHLVPPEYHGNPVSAKGSLVFTDFGWDCLSTLRAVGFSDVAIELYASAEYGHLGDAQLIFRCTKSPYKTTRVTD